MFKRLVYNILMGMLVISSLVTALGIAYLAEPEFFNWMFDWLELTEAQRSYFITCVGGTTVMAWGVRVLKTVVNTDTLKRDALHQLEMQKVEERYQAEISSLKSDFAEALKIMTENQNTLIANDNVIIEQNNLLIAERQANAERMVTMSDTLVPIEVKDSYKQFLTKSRNTRVIDNVKQFYVENVEVIEKIVKPVTTEIKRSISERIAMKNGKDVNNV